MKTKSFMGLTFQIPDNMEFSYNRDAYSHYCNCMLRSDNAMFSENFVLSAMDSSSEIKYKIGRYIDKLQSNMNSSSIAALGLMNSNSHARLHVQSSYASGYDPYASLGGELSQMSNQINKLKQKSKKLLLLF